ncbi:hypothetical protein Taro_000322 [Colocasia esculenta]|uniref:Uncharacterized protein n=1 Tax=Colocasia esculenta TaxID=4460 RepID=A0A843TCP6_COLES|nr:hypothetical protein [Colocasia esculenta]
MAASDAIKIHGWRPPFVPLIHVGCSTCAAKFIRIWLLVAGVVPMLERMSLGVRTGVSSRPQHHRDLLYFLLLHLWIMEYSCRAQAPIPQRHDHGGPSIMERFKRMAPPSFKGESDPFLERADVWWASLLRTQFEDDAIEVAWDEFVRLFRAKFVPEHI